MIFEQAFFALPEFLVGTGFTRYDSEGTLVMAYAMAVLQELNGRNVPAPVALISGEKPFPSCPSRCADLHLNYGAVGTHNPSLATFGVHNTSWLEAKFFRKRDGKPTSDTTSATYDILRDLLRLLCFPPHDVGAPINCGRYLLHAYEGEHGSHLAMQRNDKGGRVDRGWLKGLHCPGETELVFGDLSLEPGEFDKQVGKPFRDLKINASVTTFAVGGKTTPYTLCLSRIDKFSIERGTSSIVVNEKDSTENPAGFFTDLTAHVDKELEK
jgi:hypothetical protein